jgi:hypothetical protein
VSVIDPPSGSATYVVTILPASSVLQTLRVWYRSGTGLSVLVSQACGGSVRGLVLSLPAKGGLEGGGETSPGGSRARGA